MVYREEIGLKVALLVLAIIFLTIGSLFATPPVGEKTHETAQATARIMKELVEVYKSDSYKKGLFEVEPVEDNLYEWNVKLFFNYSKSPIREDLQRMKKLGKDDHVMLRVSFDGNYPVEPPLFRTVYPSFQTHMGSNFKFGTMCMYQLSRQGWVSDFTMEGILLMIIDFIELMKMRVESGKVLEPTPEEARAEFERVIRGHGWHHERPTDLPWHIVGTPEYN